MAVQEETRFLTSKEVRDGVQISTVYEGVYASTLENENLQVGDACPNHSGFFITSSSKADIPKGTSKNTFQVQAFKFLKKVTEIERTYGKEIQIHFEGSSSDSLSSLGLTRNQEHSEYPGFYVSSSAEDKVPDRPSRRRFNITIFKVHDNRSHA